MSHWFGCVYDRMSRFSSAVRKDVVCFQALLGCQSLTPVVIFVIFLQRYVVCSIAVNGPSDGRMVRSCEWSDECELTREKNF